MLLLTFILYFANVFCTRFCFSCGKIVNPSKFHLKQRKLNNSVLLRRIDCTVSKLMRYLVSLGLQGGKFFKYIFFYCYFYKTENQQYELDYVQILKNNLEFFLKKRE